MRSLTMPWSGTLSVTLVATGCSLMGLGDFDIPECTSNEQCQPLNRENGITELRLRDWDDDGAYAAQCAAELEDSRAVDCDDNDPSRAPGLTESCDGVDNDCDLIIDEGALSGSPPTEPLIAELDSPDRAFLGAGSESRPLVILDSSGDVRVVMLGDPSSEPRSLEYGYQTEPDAVDVVGDGSQCPADNVAGVNACNFADVAGDRVGTDWIVASVSTEGCAQGQLKVGYTEGQDGVVVLRGPEQHSNLYLGVDLEGACTGASRNDGTVGVARPSVAGGASAGALPQALVAFLADDVRRDPCGGSVVDVEVLGAWLESVPNRMGLKWTNGTNDGVPERVGSTTGGGRPALARYSAEARQGYVLAYGCAEGGVALHFIPAFADPPEYVFGDANTVRPTDGLAPPEAIVVAESHSGADQVALSVSPGSDPDRVRVGIAWREGCEAGSVSVWMVAGEYSPDSGSLVANDPVELTHTGGTGSSGPAVVYVESGFVMPGFIRDERTADDVTTGGWVVAWVEESDGASALRAVRVLALDGQPVDEEPWLLQSRDAAIVVPGLYARSGGEQLGFAYYDEAGSEMVEGVALCVDGDGS